MKNLFSILLTASLVLLGNSSLAQNSCEGLFLNPDSSLNQESNQKRTSVKSKGALGDEGLKRSRQFGLRDFFNSDLSNNIAALHPYVLVSAEQKLNKIINSYPVRVAKDPLYRVEPIYIYPAFHEGHGSQRGKLIIGQYSAIHELVNYVAGKAAGRGSGKIPLFIGPPGTGKTESALVLSELLDVHITGKQEDADYTYEWINLDKVPALKPLLPSLRGELTSLAIPAPMNESPFALLREDLKKEVVNLVEKEVEKKIGNRPIVNFSQHPQTLRILEEIFAHKFEAIRSREMEIEDVTKEEYLETLAEHVRLVRIKPAKNRPDPIIRAMPSNPDLSKLFNSENIRLKMFYREGDPLLYNYDGKVLSSNRRVLVFDEVFRNDPDSLLPILLEVGQNGVAETDMGPAVRLDALTFVTANDESMAKARSDSALNALINRQIQIPMRANLAPTEIASVAMIMVDPKNTNFYMRELDVTGTKKDFDRSIKPLELTKVFTLPDENGNTLSASGRYALYYKQAGQTILIAPHTIEMLALVTTASRIIKDGKKIQPFLSELNALSSNSNLYTTVKGRLDVITGATEVDESVRRDLANFTKLLREGETGISARDIKTWLEHALDLALTKNTGVLTPGILNESFYALMAQSRFETPGLDRPGLLERYETVKTEYILPKIHKDLRNIVSGDGERANRLYDTIEQELIAISINKDASSWHPDDGSGAKPINKARLEEVKRLYLAKTGQEFAPQFLLRHLNQNQRSGSRVRNRELMDVINEYLAEKEMNITEDMSQIAEYYKGNLRDAVVEKRVRDTESRYEQYGYNREAFVEAVAFWSEVTNRLKTKQ